MTRFQARCVVTRVYFSWIANKTLFVPADLTVFFMYFGYRKLYLILLNS